jgi:hypothetical protein
LRALPVRSRRFAARQFLSRGAFAALQAAGGGVKSAPDLAQQAQIRFQSAITLKSPGCKTGLLPCQNAKKPVSTGESARKEFALQTGVDRRINRVTARARTEMTKNVQIGLDDRSAR